MEVGWHLRFAQEDTLEFLVLAKLVPNVEDAVFIAGNWSLTWEQVAEADPDTHTLRAVTKRQRTKQ